MESRITSKGEIKRIIKRLVSYEISFFINYCNLWEDCV